jgi:hypothetical protein
MAIKVTILLYPISSLLDACFLFWSSVNSLSILIVLTLFIFAIFYEYFIVSPHMTESNFKAPKLFKTAKPNNWQGGILCSQKPDRMLL